MLCMVLRNTAGRLHVLYGLLLRMALRIAASATHAGMCVVMARILIHG